MLSSVKSEVPADSVVKTELAIVAELADCVEENDNDWGRTAGGDASAAAFNISTVLVLGETGRGKGGGGATGGMGKCTTGRACTFVK